MTPRMPHKSSFGGTGSPYNMFFVSLLLHVIAIATIMITVPTTSRQLTFGAPYSVALVGPEIMQTAPQGISGARGMIQTPSPSPPVILKRSTNSSQASVIKKNDTGKTDIEKAISAIKEKKLSQPTLPRQAAVPPSGGASPGGSPSQQNEYSLLIWSRVKKNWTLPAALMPKNNLVAVIDVRIAQSGAVEYIGFEKRSGNSYFDESALRAIKKSIPFPPLPGWVTGRSVEIGIRFHSEELR